MPMSVCNFKKKKKTGKMFLSQEGWNIVLRPWGDRLKSVFMFHLCVQGLKYTELIFLVVVFWGIYILGVYMELPM